MGLGMSKKAAMCMCAVKRARNVELIRYRRHLLDACEGPGNWIGSNRRNDCAVHMDTMEDGVVLA